MNLALLLFISVISIALYLFSSSWVLFAIFKTTFSVYHGRSYDKVFLNLLGSAMPESGSPVLQIHSNMSPEKHTGNPEGAKGTRSAQQASLCPRLPLPPPHSPSPSPDSHLNYTPRILPVGLALPPGQPLALHPSSCCRHSVRACCASGLRWSGRTPLSKTQPFLATGYSQPCQYLPIPAHPSPVFQAWREYHPWNVFV